MSLAQLYVRTLTSEGELVIHDRRSKVLGADVLTKVLGEQKLVTLLPFLNLS